MIYMLKCKIYLFFTVSKIINCFSITVFGIERCNSDYITIPGGVFVDKNGVSRNMERFCGTKFPNKVSSEPIKP